MDKQYASLMSTEYAHVYSIEKVNQLKRNKKSYLLITTLCFDTDVPLVTQIK